MISPLRDLPVVKNLFLGDIEHQMHWEGIASIWLALYTLSAVTVKGAIFAIPQEFRENYNDDLNGDSDTYLTARELEAAYELIAGNTWPNFPRSDEELLSPGTVL